MSVDEKKTFVIKHTFSDIKNVEKGSFGEKETHFNVPWRVCIGKCHSSCCLNIFLQCPKLNDGKEWSIDTTIKSRILNNFGEHNYETKRQFSDRKEKSKMLVSGHRSGVLAGGNLTVECHVTIDKMTGIKKPFVNKFDDESAKEFSDVVLKVKDEKFHVFKMYLARHSSYFKSLFLGNFNESKQSEVELKDIEPEDFQNFLQVLYGDSNINDETVHGILLLADMYDAKSAIRQCEKFLVNYSKLDLKEKLLLATQYKLDDLNRKCTPEFTTPENIAPVDPETASQSKMWDELSKL